jgi:hypothetical protein
MEEIFSKPTCEHMYFVTDGEKTSYFKTENDAKEFATELIEYCIQDDEIWIDEDIETIAMGRVTHTPKCQEKELRPDDLDDYNCSGDGEHWPDGLEWRGYYVMVEVEPDKKQQLLTAAKAVIERWDSPLWKHQEHTGKFIDELRKAVARFDEKTVNDC